MLLFEEHLKKIDQFVEEGFFLSTRLRAPARNTLASEKLQGNYIEESIEEAGLCAQQEEANSHLLEEGIALMERLIQSAQREKEESRKLCNEYGKERTLLIKRKEEASSEYSNVSAANQKLAAEIQWLLEYSVQLEKERNSLATQLEDITIRIHKANEKAKTAQKWCWVQDMDYTLPLIVRRILM